MTTWSYGCLYLSFISAYVLNASPLSPGLTPSPEILGGEKSSGASVWFGFDVVLGQGK